MPLLKVRRALSAFIILFVFLPSLSYSQEVFSSYIFINQEPFDEPVWVEYEPENFEQTVIHIGPALSSIETILSKEFGKKIRGLLFDEVKVKVKDLEKIGVKAKVDLSTLNIYLSVDKKDKKLNKLKLSNYAHSEKTDFLTPEFFSGYFNFRLSNRFDGDRQKNQPQNYENDHALLLEGVLNFGGLVFEDQHTYSQNSQNLNEGWQRNYTRLVYDDQKNLVRYRLGDVDNLTRGFQEALFGLGFEMRREFSIRPSYFRSSFKTHKFYLDSPSRLEIFVNGKLVKTEILPQGPVELSDFPFNAGQNSVRVKITDAFGSIRFLDFSDLNDSRLLPQGRSDFNLTYVNQRTDLFYQSDFKDAYAFDRPVLSGFYHRGILKDFVLGFDGQYSEDYYLTGLEGLYGKEDGLFKLNLAHSLAERLNGGAARFEYENYLFKDGVLNGMRFILSAEYRSEDFRTLSLLQSHRYSLRGSVGQNFKQNIRASFGASKEWFWGNQEDKTYLTSNFGWSFMKNFDFSANIRVRLEDTKDSVVLLSLNWYSPHNNQQFVSVYDPVNEVANAEYLTYPLDGRQNFRTFVSGDVSSFSKRARVGLDYFNQRYEAKAAHSVAVGDNDNFSQTTQLNWGSAVAFTSKGISWSRPIDNSFALVSMPDRPRRYDIPVGRGEKSQRAEINSWGPGSITNLAPYYTDQFYLDLKNLPYGYSLEKESYRFKSTYKSGVHIQVNVKGSVSLFGRAVLENADPAVYTTAHIYEKSDSGERLEEPVGQFFTGSDGSFSVEDLEAKSYILEFESESGEIYLPFHIEIDKKMGVIQMEKDLILKRGN